jgi:hypothetical protein
MGRTKTRRWGVLDECSWCSFLLLAIRRSRSGMRDLGYGVGYGQAFIADTVLICLVSKAKGFDSGDLNRDIHMYNKILQKSLTGVTASPTP